MLAAAAAAGVLAFTWGTGAPAAAAPDRAEISGVRPSWASPGAHSGEVPPDRRLAISLTLPMRDEGGAHALARAVSTPGSGQHRRFLEAEAFRTRFSPTTQTTEQVRSWLTGQGLEVTSTTANRRMVTAVGTAATVQKAFGTTLGLFRVPVPASNGQRDLQQVLLHAPSAPVTVPMSLRGKVSGVLGLDGSAALHRPMWVRSTVTARPGGESSVEAAGNSTYCARYWGQENNQAVPQRYPRQSNENCGYNFAQARAIHRLGPEHTGAGSTVGIVGAYSLSTMVSDLNRNARTVGAPQLRPGQYVDKSVPETEHPSCNATTSRESWNGEQALDAEAAHGIAPQARLVYYGAGNCTQLYEALARAVSEGETDVLSLSWGTNYENVAEATRTELTQLAVQAAIQGQAVVASSGDAGDNSTANPAGKASPTFPAVNPWVTSVGGTSVGLNRDNSVAVLAGWQNTGFSLVGGVWRPLATRDGAFAGGGGGGVSALYDAPEWQRGVVPQSISGGKRAMPDVAATGDANTGILVGHTTAAGYVEGPTGGTSWSAPSLAGLLANAQQVQGAGRIGFANPALYRLAGSDAFADVTQESAAVWQQYLPRYPGTSTPTARGSYLTTKDEKPQSLQSTKGWDVVTGLGMPTGAAFLSRLGRG
ncbi:MULTISPECIES: protease pro-enzyme activation domain-containing protein [unclassified Crossiella]|uniref:S53 family peptidase n=1 Tax=unclassified Crossiella TaxID=2620835 RepID=UPI001FFE5110|nr:MULTISPECIES: S53 family peptidase [unclassified Crossiella]MCK2252683.1 S53 family peptidase [Crossiella sp. S99.1]